MATKKDENKPSRRRRRNVKWEQEKAAHDKTKKSRATTSANLAEYRKAPGGVLQGLITQGVAFPLSFAAAAAAGAASKAAMRQAAQGKEPSGFLKFMGDPAWVQSLIAVLGLPLLIVQTKMGPTGQAVVCAIVDGLVTPATVRLADKVYGKTLGKDAASSAAAAPVSTSPAAGQPDTVKGLGIEVLPPHYVMPPTTRVGGNYTIPAGAF